MFFGAVSTIYESCLTLAFPSIVCLLSWIFVPKIEHLWFGWTVVAVFASYDCYQYRHRLCVPILILFTLYCFMSHEIVLAEHNSTSADNVTVISTSGSPLFDNQDLHLNASHNSHSHGMYGNETRLAAKHVASENLSSELSDQNLQPTEASQDLADSYHTDDAFLLNSTQPEWVNVTSDSAEWSGLSAGTIAGTAVGCIILLALISGISLYIMWRHRLKTLAENKDQPSNNYTGLWDESIMLSYINSQFDVPKEPYDVDMISLDNDAYLNSLESMIASNWNNPRPNTRF